MRAENFRFGGTMNRGSVLIILTVAVAASLACQSPTVVGLTATDEAALRQALNTEMTSANAADAAGWASLYSQDAIVLRPNGPAVQGREAIQQWLATLPPISKAKGEGIEAVGYGDLAYLRGSYSMTFSIPGVPAPIEEQGKFLQIYRKQSDGSWKMTREIYNSDLPLPAPPPASSPRS
jgi:ketosteroid isomerase-like protein